MSDCEHPWKQIEPKDGGVIECAECHQRWRGPAAEFVWRRAQQAIADLNRRLDKVTEALDTHCKLLSCDTCGAFFPRESSKHGINIQGNYICYACAPEWLVKVGNRYEDRERRYARMVMARWLSRHWYYNEHTASLWRELEAEMIQARKDEGRLTYAIN